jgi:hypothetical protein
MLERPPPSRRARWQRAYRQRLKAGRIVVGVELDAVLIDFLIRLGWLEEKRANDKKAIALAITAVLADAEAASRQKNSDA